MAYIVIVDDDEDFASAAATALRNAGHEVQIEPDAAGAIGNMETRPPDLAILDVMFPENPSAGFELARTMRHDSEKLKTVPVLMLTAVNARFPLGFSDQDIDDTWLPVADFLEKPVDLDSLEDKVQALLAKAGVQGSQADQQT